LFGAIGVGWGWCVPVELVWWAKASLAIWTLSDLLSGHWSQRNAMSYYACLVSNVFVCACVWSERNAIGAMLCF